MKKLILAILAVWITDTLVGLVFESIGWTYDVVSSMVGYIQGAVIGYFVLVYE